MENLKENKDLITVCFLVVLLFGLLNVSCVSQAKMAKRCTEMFPTKETTVIVHKRDTTIEHDTMTNYISFNCDSLTSEILNEYTTSFDKQYDSLSSIKNKVIVREVKIPKTTTVISYYENKETRFRDSALIVVLKDSMFNQAGKIIKLETKVQDLQKGHENQKQWKFYFLIAFLISLLANVIQYYWNIRKETVKDVVKTFKF